MGNEEAIEVLRYARDFVLSDESRWIQDSFGGEDEGYCLLGAVSRAGFVLDRADVTDAWKALYDAVQSDTPHPGPLTFNDHQATTYPEVIDVLDSAIKSLEDPA